MSKTLGRRGDNLWTFCEAVCQVVLQKLREEGADDAWLNRARQDALWHASQLWEGTHPQEQGFCRNRRRATEIVYKHVGGDRCAV